jgi:homocysteine S-methyltransferase
MSFINFLNKEEIIITDGPMETRVIYNTDIPIDRDGSIFRLVFSAPEREILADFYRQDLDIASKYKQAILLNAPTTRASEERIATLGFDPEHTARINSDCVNMVREIRQEYPDLVDKIMINGPVGPKYDAYNPDGALTAHKSRDYHTPQIHGLIEGGVDLVSGVVFPSVEEALGVAQACSDFNFPYSIGFVLTRAGKLLDGTHLADAIQRIDSEAGRKPLYYMIICTHSSIAQQALTPHKEIYKRIYGIKANGSGKTPEELAKSDKPEADPPEDFAKNLMALHEAFGFKIIGGCCGTDSRHVEALCKIIKENI